jgi:hypothetical protein
MTSPNEAWTLEMADQVLGRLGKPTDQPKFIFRAIRNACAGQLNNYKITWHWHEKCNWTPKRNTNVCKTLSKQALISGSPRFIDWWQRGWTTNQSITKIIHSCCTGSSPKDMDELYNNANLVQLKSDHQQVSVAYKFLHVQSIIYPFFSII